MNPDDIERQSRDTRPQPAWREPRRARPPRPAKKPIEFFPGLLGIWFGVLLAVLIQGLLSGPSDIVEFLASVGNSAVIWALVGLLILFIGEHERNRLRASGNEPRPLKSAPFLIGIIVPVAAMLLGATPAAWSAHRFRSTIARADRIEIRGGGFNTLSALDGQPVLAVVTNAAEIAAFNRMIRFETLASLFRCRCIGYPGIDWWRDGKRVALTSLQHKRAIRWDGFTGDRPLTEGSAEELCRWLEDHGIDPDGSAYSYLYERQMREAERLLEEMSELKSRKSSKPEEPQAEEGESAGRTAPTTAPRDGGADPDPAADNPVGVGIGAPDPVFGEGVTPDPNLMFVWDEALWVGVLYSSSIVVADVDFSALAGAGPEARPIELPFVVRDCLKGSLPGTNLVLKAWSGDQKEMESLRASAPTNLTNGSALLFLVGPFEELGPECFLAREYRYAIQRADEKSIAETKREIDAQRRALEAFDRLVAPESLPHWSAVSNAVAELTIDADHQSRSVDAILDLGIEAVPALISLMDDRRELPEKSVALRNHAPNSWEPYRQYAPETVVDLADALADHSVKIGLISVMNGGTERERQGAVARWRTLLIRWLNENRKSGRFLKPVLLGSYAS